MKACIRRVEGDAERLTTGCPNSYAWRVALPALPAIEPERLTGRDVSVSVLAAVDSTGTQSGSEGEGDSRRRTPVLSRGRDSANPSRGPLS